MMVMMVMIFPLNSLTWKYELVFRGKIITKVTKVTKVLRFRCQERYSEAPENSAASPARKSFIVKLFSHLLEGDGAFTSLGTPLSVPLIQCSCFDTHIG